MKLDLVIVQINTIKVDLKFFFNAHMARKYGSQNVPQGRLLVTKSCDPGGQGLCKIG